MSGGLLQSAADLLYPPDLYCICCGNLIDDSRTYHLCDHCMAHIQWSGDPPAERDGMRLLHCVRYGLYARRLIFELKYNGKQWIARDLAEICADRLALAGVSFDVIVPVPLYPKKERQRGFNQAAMIGRHLAARTDTVCLAHGLRRTRPTQPMRGLSPEERSQNVRDAFQLEPRHREAISGRRVLLLDDFYTTGSTAAACFAALQEAAPASVWFLAFAARV